jgi:hypothetical protein
MNKLKVAKRQTLDGILFLAGVYKKDCKKIEDFFHERLLYDNTADSKMYDKIPMTFSSMENWPQSTNLTCWLCNRTFKNRPWFEPQSIESVNKGDVGIMISSADIKKTKVENSYCIHTKGNFCSANCVMRYIIIYSKDLSDKLNKIAMLKILYEIFTGRKLSDIIPSPLPIEMVQYGGSISQQAYQKKIEDLNIYNSVNDDGFSANCKTYVNRFIMD